MRMGNWFSHIHCERLDYTTRLKPRITDSGYILKQYIYKVIQQQPWAVMTVNAESQVKEVMLALAVSLGLLGNISAVNPYAERDAFSKITTTIWFCSWQFAMCCTYFSTHQIFITFLLPSHIEIQDFCVKWWDLRRQYFTILFQAF